MGNTFNTYSMFEQQSYNAPTHGTDTNVVLVTSLEEAVMRTTRPNSERVYFHQSLPTFYRVKVDFDGRKTYQEFTYSQPSAAVNTPATQADIQPILARLDALESKLTGEVGASNAKSDG